MSKAATHIQPIDAKKLKEQLKHRHQTTDEKGDDDDEEEENDQRTSGSPNKQQQQQQEQQRPRKESEIQMQSWSHDENHIIDG